MNKVASTSISAQIREEINAISEGEVFDYRRFDAGVEKQAAVIKALSRLVQAGELVRLEKGKFFKPLGGRSSELRPVEHSVIYALTTRGNIQTGYLTGTALYHQMGLTVQVPTVITIARSTRLPEKILNGYVIRYVIRPFSFTTEDVVLLQMLDVCKDIRSIPDVSPEIALDMLFNKMQALSEPECDHLVRLALKYNPSTRALVGAMLQHLFPHREYPILRQSLNPLSRFNLPFAARLISAASCWQIR